MSNIVIILIKVWQTRSLSQLIIPLLLDFYLVLINSVLYFRKTISVKLVFWYILIMLFWYQKRINTLWSFLLLRIFLKVVTVGPSILHVFDEGIVASEIFSLTFVLCYVWMCLVVHRLYTSKFLCHYPVLLLASVSGFLPLRTPFHIDCTSILSILLLNCILFCYLHVLRQESVYCRP